MTQTYSSLLWRQSSLLGALSLSLSPAFFFLIIIFFLRVCDIYIIHFFYLIRDELVLFLFSNKDVTLEKWHMQKFCSEYRAERTKAWEENLLSETLSVWNEETAKGVLCKSDADYYNQKVNDKPHGDGVRWRWCIISSVFIFICMHVTCDLIERTMWCMKRGLVSALTQQNSDDDTSWVSARRCSSLYMSCVVNKDFVIISASANHLRAITRISSQVWLVRASAFVSPCRLLLLINKQTLTNKIGLLKLKLFKKIFIYNSWKLCNIML